MKETYHIIVDEDPRPAIADVFFWPTLGAYVIHRINVPPAARGKRHGSRLLSQILADADREGVTLALAPEPSGGLNYEALIDWYERHGFKFTPSGAMMERSPKQNPARTPRP